MGDAVLLAGRDHQRRARRSDFFVEGPALHFRPRDIGAQFFAIKCGDGRRVVGRGLHHGGGLHGDWGQQGFEYGEVSRTVRAPTIPGARLRCTILALGPRLPATGKLPSAMST
jgi:hypothetical protein